MAERSSSEGVSRAGACKAEVQEGCSEEVVSPSVDEPETQDHTGVVVTANRSDQRPLSRALLVKERDGHCCALRAPPSQSPLHVRLLLETPFQLQVFLLLAANGRQKMN